MGTTSAFQIRCRKCGGRILQDYDGAFCINCGWRSPDRYTPISSDELQQTAEAMHNIRYPVPLPFSTQE